MIAVIGSGPAGLMCAHELSKLGLKVELFEKRPSFGRKLLIAGSSGLNVSHELPLAEFIAHYEGFSSGIWERFLSQFSVQDWLDFIHELGFETFLGTSSRYFVKEMKASKLLQAWVQLLKDRGVVFHANHAFQSISEYKRFQAVGLFLGGGSWEDETPEWPENLRRELGIEVKPFVPRNVGYEVDWSREFLNEAERKPLKNIVLESSLGSKAGELMITEYGLEGTPIYFLGETGEVTIDLKPALTFGEIRERVRSVRENLSPIRRIKKTLGLSDEAIALLFHHSLDSDKADLEKMIARVKAFPIQLKNPRPLSEAISSSGGISLSEVSTELGSELMLKKRPGIFCGGEMLDWSAPTGGFLIQACVTQGVVAARSIARYLSQVLRK